MGPPRAIQGRSEWLLLRKVLIDVGVRSRRDQDAFWTATNDPTVAFFHALKTQTVDVLLNIDAMCERWNHILFHAAMEASEADPEKIFVDVYGLHLPITELTLKEQPAMKAACERYCERSLHKASEASADDLVVYATTSVAPSSVVVAPPRAVGHTVVASTVTLEEAQAMASEIVGLAASTSSSSTSVSRPAPPGRVPPAKRARSLDSKAPAAEGSVRPLDTRKCPFGDHPFYHSGALKTSCAYYRWTQLSDEERFSRHERMMAIPRSLTVRAKVLRDGKEQREQKTQRDERVWGSVQGVREFWIEQFGLLPPSDVTATASSTAPAAALPPVAGPAASSEL